MDCFLDVPGDAALDLMMHNSILPILMELLRHQILLLLSNSLILLRFGMEFIFKVPMRMIGMVMLVFLRVLPMG